jgi:hypothetical protein
MIHAFHHSSILVYFFSTIIQSSHVDVSFLFTSWEEGLRRETLVSDKMDGR